MSNKYNFILKAFHYIDISKCLRYLWMHFIESLLDLVIKFYIKLCVSALEVLTFSGINNLMCSAILDAIVGLFIGQCLMVCLFSGALRFF